MSVTDDIQSQQLEQLVDELCENLWLKEYEKFYSILKRTNRIQDLMIDNCENNLLFLIVQNDDLEVLQNTFNIIESRKFSNLQKSLWINHRNIEGNTAIFYAVKNNNLQIFKFLEQNEASIFVINNHGHSLAHWAVKFNNIEVLVYLTHRIDFNKKDNIQQTPLIWACKLDRLSASQYLLRTNVELNIQDEDNNTALHYAVEQQNFYQILSLLFRDVDKSLRNNKNQKPLDIAIEQNNKKIIGLFVNQKEKQKYFQITFKLFNVC